MFFLVVAFRATNIASATWAIRSSLTTALLIPCGFNFLRLSISRQSMHFSDVLRHSRLLAGVALLVVAPLCLTGLFVRSAVFPDHPGIPAPVYGFGFVFYAMFTLAAHSWVIWKLINDARIARGIRRIELNYLMLASVICIVVAVSVTVVLPPIIGNAQIVQLAPVSALAFLLIIAYGIATRRIMDVSYFLRGLVAYSLLATALEVIYLFSFAIVRFLQMQIWLTPSVHIPHFIAALAVAFAMTPAHGRFRSVTDKLFVHMPATDIARSVRRVNAALQSIGTLSDMLERFAAGLHELLGAESVFILLREGTDLVQVYPVPGDTGDGDEASSVRMTVGQDEPLAVESVASVWPVVLDVMNRRVQGETLAEAGRFMRENHIAASAAVRSKEVLQGLLLFGPRISGKVYGLTEQQVMQAAADQLAVAVENAVLYTEVQDGKIYNEILLDNLVNGVVACDAAGKTTVFNKEAERITGLSSRNMVGRGVDRLPDPLRAVLASALEGGLDVRNRDILLRNAAGDPVPLQAGCGVFRGHRGGISGALLVFSDMTLVKRLETQVRRTAHLASVGTLSAGMAHEIKNPLVTVKTFAQLLPEKFDDEEFRTTFSELVAKEVNRIDRIVNQLLKFGRPSKAQLIRVSLRDVLEQSLQLVQVQAEKKGVRIDRELDGGDIAGDPRLLEQAFINFFLNAIEAMDAGGTLSVSTALVHQPLPVTSVFENAYPDRHYVVRIEDTGIGISEEDLPQVFDPFFTARKSNGTGLGLSVAYSIIQEHGGGIDIASQLGVGTTFHVMFPALQEDALRMLRTEAAEEPAEPVK
jgi:PAS domain S-box-containing protein